ncbi:hypothetical protein HFP57_07625 [Parasphingopyxis algicola]|uniref:hypothetical protein n=1 Tax=Parasphingopyxis algicola TaxID=2026624 RepID=UPI0015A1C5E4|nr:hypothetical protein [Parasphingopyxis algicola]QLC24911.1 hypothetical protein HFP57_07625 [Parasphingopyxis algicola]
MGLGQMIEIFLQGKSSAGRGKRQMVSKSKTRKVTLHFASVDALKTQAINLGLAVVGCCHLSGLLVRRDAAGAPASSNDESRPFFRALTLLGI